MKIMTNPDNKTFAHYAFDSIQDFGHYIKSAKEMPKSNTSSLKVADFSWDHGFDYMQALEMTENGGAWLDGAKNLQKIEVPSLSVYRLSDALTIENSVHGFAPIIPLFLMGVPDCMMQMAQQKVKSKIITLYIDISFSYKIKSYQILNRGKAILSLIEQLELQGYSVELVGVRNAVHSEIKSQNMIEIIVKKAGESFTPASIAFVFCCAAFSRRMLFRLCECCPKSWRLTTKGYGYSAEFPINKNNSLYIKTINSNRAYEYDTIESAIDTLSKEVKTQLIGD